MQNTKNVANILLMRKCYDYMQEKQRQTEINIIN